MLKRLIILCLLTTGCAMAQQERDARLAVFVGHWEGGGKFYDTKFSKPDKVMSSGDCNWSPQNRYLLCEQTITDGKGVHGQLTVFYPNDKNEIAYSTFQNGAKPVGSTVKIEGNVWTFQDTFTNDGVETTIRTTNRFEGAREIFKVEYSQDKGKDWTTMLDGEQKKQSKN